MLAIQQVRNGIIVYLNNEEMMIDLSNINVILPRDWDQKRISWQLFLATVRVKDGMEWYVEWYVA